MIIPVSDFGADYLETYEILKRQTGKRKAGRVKTYLDCVAAFDIETSYISAIDETVMYIWMFQFSTDITVIGRTWPEYMSFTSMLDQALQVRDAHLVVYVHNLSYEFTFLKSLFYFAPDDVFSVKPRKVLRCDHGQLEYRCSYLLSNMSLKMFTHKWAVKHEKLSGSEFDYDEIRYYDTELTKRQLDYCVNDVLGLVEALQAEMQFNNDNLYTVPLTSTGYVRRDVKAALRKCFWLKETYPDYEVFMELRRAFRGGDTHANRYYVAQEDNNYYTLSDITGCDRSSSYPSEQLLSKYPMGKFKAVSKKVSLKTVVNHYIKKRGYACLLTLRVAGLRIKNQYIVNPYISKSMLRNYSHSKTVKQKVDNGRILKFLTSCEFTITDIDLQIILEQYDLIRPEVISLYYTKYDYLPEELRALVLSYYQSKTMLKGDPEKKPYYDKYKNLLNSIYGCAAQDYSKPLLLFVFDSTQDTYVWRDEDKTAMEVLADAHPAEPYQWGVWTTAHARKSLYDAVKYLGRDFVYSDTDSVYFRGDHDLSEINARIYAQAEKMGATAAEPGGKIHHIGVWELDGKYKSFRVLGAKCYAMVDYEGNLKVTVAGVPKADKETKTRGAYELARNGGLDAFREGFTFSEGITVAQYHDYKNAFYREYDGRKLLITSNVSILPSTHIIGASRSQEYIDVLRDVLKWLKNSGNYDRIIAGDFYPKTLERRENEK